MSLESPRWSDDDPRHAEHDLVANLRNAAAETDVRLTREQIDKVFGFASGGLGSVGVGFDGEDEQPR